MTQPTTSDSINPYAPVLETAAIEVDSEVDLVRRKYLNHEASVQSIGSLFIFGGIVLVVMGVVTLLSYFETDDQTELIVGTIYLVLGPIQFITGVSLQRLSPWSRKAGAALAAIGLLAFPIGTLINGYFLYLLLSKKGVMVFSPEYAAVRAATPHIKYKHSRWVVGCLVGFVLLVVFLIGVALFGRSTSN